MIKELSMTHTIAHKDFNNVELKFMYELTKDKGISEIVYE